MNSPQYPKRLIEVDLPIKRISAHARREKSIRHGHISTLHIWWARRPLAACRAVICAALWPDPVDDNCPQPFRDKAAELITSFAVKATTKRSLADSCSQESIARWLILAKPENRLDPTNLAQLNALRFALLDFIADFANWDNSTVKEYLETSRALTQAAHESLGGEPGTRPLVVDPFAGGGSIPLEALRVGADAFASDLNPVAVLLNKVVLEYIPKYGQRLADEVRKWGKWIKKEAEKELAEFYPKDPDGATPIAYLWARTITCEGPGCGAEVPLLRSLWLAKKGGRAVALRLVSNQKAKRVDFEIIENAKVREVGEGTTRNGSATCPICGFTTPKSSVRRQLKECHCGTNNARLFCLVTTRRGEQGRFYRLPTDGDLEAVSKAGVELERRKSQLMELLSLIPDEPIPQERVWKNNPIRVHLYGIVTWGSLFSARQALALTTIVQQVHSVDEYWKEQKDSGLAVAVRTCLALVVDRLADGNSSLSRWQSTGEKISNTFGRQALPMVWDFCEANPFCEATRSLESMFEWIAEVGDHEACNEHPGQVENASATAHPLPDDTASAFISDPPYYDAVPYANLSDFFYVWLKRTLPRAAIDSFSSLLAPKEDECVVDEAKDKDHRYFEQTMTKAMTEGRRVLNPNGIGLVVFAHKSTAGWEAQLQAMVDAGWTMTGSWPIDTEMGLRLRARNSATLVSSVHLVCRPRENPDGAVRTEDVGDWRDVLTELPSASMNGCRAWPLKE